MWDKRAISTNVAIFETSDTKHLNYLRSHREAFALILIIAILILLKRITTQNENVNQNSFLTTNTSRIPKALQSPESLKVSLKRCSSKWGLDPSLNTHEPHFSWWQCTQVSSCDSVVLSRSRHRKRSTGPFRVVVIDLSHHNGPRDEGEKLYQ